MKRRSERRWWHSTPLLLAVALLFPGLGLAAVAFWPGVERIRKVDVIVRGVAIMVVYGAIYLLVGSLEDDKVRDRLIVTAGVLLLFTILLRPLVRKRAYLLAPPGGSRNPSVLADFVLDLYEDLPDKRSFVDLAATDMAAWQAGVGLAEDHFEQNLRTGQVETMSTHDIARLAAAKCTEEFMPMLQHRAEPENSERLTVFCLGFVWALTNLLDYEPRHTPGPDQPREAHWRI